MYETLISDIPVFFIVFIVLSILLTTINFCFIKLIVKLKSLFFVESFLNYFLRSMKLLFIICLILISLLFIPIIQFLSFSLAVLFEYLPFVLLVFIVINIIYSIIIKNYINRFINLLFLESAIIVSSTIIRMILGFLA